MRAIADAGSITPGPPEQSATAWGEQGSDRSSGGAASRWVRRPGSECRSKHGKPLYSSSESQHVGTVTGPGIAFMLH
jgi:predicted lipoprotein with Yx(FWY)xxD motif